MVNKEKKPENLQGHYQYLLRFLKNTRIFLFIFDFLGRLLFLLMLLTICAIIMNILEVLGIFYGPTRLVFIALTSAGLGFILVKRVIVPSLKTWPLEKVAVYSEKKLGLRHNELINSLELAPQILLAGQKSLPFSPILVQQLLNHIALFLRSHSPSTIPEKIKLMENARYLAMSLIGLLFLGVLQPSLFRNAYQHLIKDSAPWLQEVEIRVITGDKTVLKGQEFNIEAEVLSGEVQPAKLYYVVSQLSINDQVVSRSQLTRLFEEGKWQSVPMLLSTAPKNESGNATGVDEPKGRFFKQTLTAENNLNYVIVAAGSHSQAYHIRVVEPPEVGDIFLSYNYPRYSAKEQKIQGPVPGDISALKGTQVEIKSNISKRVNKAEIVINSIQRVAMDIGEGNEVKGGIIVMEEGEYTIEVTDYDGISNQKPIYHRIVIEEDKVPKIRIDLPGKDITVNNLEIVSLEYAAEDDYGLREVILHYQVGGEEKKDKVLRLDGHELSYQGKYNWNLAALNLKPGEPVSYFLEITDNDQISGPKSGFSATYYLTIYSQEQKRQELLSTQEEILREMVNILAEQLEVNDQTEASQDYKIESILNKQDMIHKRTERLIEKMAALLGAMEDQTEPGSINYYELESLISNLQRIKDNQMRQPLADILRGGFQVNIQDLVVNQREIIAELEKDVLFLYSLIKRARLENLYHLAEELLDKQLSLLEKLEELKNAKGKELLEALQKEIDKLQSLLESMAAQMAKLALNIPQDFLNSAALKGMEMDDISKQIEEIKDALAREDLEEAMAKAEELLAALTKMLSSFREYASGSSLFEMSELMRSAEEMLKELEQIIVQQKDLYRDTEDMEKGFRDKQEEFVQSKLQEFEKHIQKKLAQLQQHIQKSQTAMAQPDNRLRGLIGLFSQLHQNFSRIVLSLNPFNPSEFRQQGQQLLQELGRFETMLEQSAQRMQQRNQNESLSIDQLKEARKIAEELWKEMNSIGAESNEFLNPEDFRKLAEMMKEQGSIGDKTQNFRDKLGQLSKLSPFFGEKLGNDMREAQSYMKSAQGELGVPNPSGASSDEREALQRLKSAQEGLKEAAQKMAMGGLPSFVPSGRARSGYGQTGRMGVAKGEVQIPGPGKEKGPREFREEILRAMQEGFPEAYEKLIREYYKSITK